jgi:hypothetical protein
MPIVGDKKIFAIEWEICGFQKNSLTQKDVQVNWFFADFRYWGNSLPIGECEDSCILNSVLSYTKDFIENQNIRPNWDFSSFKKEDVFRCLHGCAFHAEIFEEFADFYTFCRETMIHYHTLRNQHLKSKRQFKIEQYLREYSLLEKDFSLSSWVKYNFSIAHLGGVSLDNHLDLYFVRDSQKKQERFVGKYHDSENIDQQIKDKIFEVILPVGYFDQVTKEFLIQGYLDIENYHQSTLMLKHDR